MMDWRSSVRMMSTVRGLERLCGGSCSRGEQTPVVMAMSPVDAPG
jgi:hypothetical protein